MGIKRRVGSSFKSSPKIFSTEFLLQNHADIVGTIIVIITVGLIFEPTSKYASKFVTIQHNTTDRKYCQRIDRLKYPLLTSSAQSIRWLLTNSKSSPSITSFNIQ